MGSDLLKSRSSIIHTTDFFNRRIKLGNGHSWGYRAGMNVRMSLVTDLILLLHQL